MPARENPPPDRCPEHLGHPDPPRCGACADHRRARQNWDRTRADQAGAEQSARARADAEARRAAINACIHCDPHGYTGATLCAHDPHGPARARAGAAAVRAAITRQTA